VAYLATAADVELVHGTDVVDENVHHAQFVAESDERPQAGWMQRDAVRVLGELAVQLQRAARSTSVVNRDVRKTEIRLGFGFKTEQSKNLTSVQTVFRYKLHAIRHSKKCIKVTLLTLNVQIKNVLKHDRNRV